MNDTHHTNERSEPTMKFKLVVFLALLSASSVSVSQRQIRQIQLNDAQLIDTSASNYALASDDLNQLSQGGWDSISVNGNKIKAWSANNCQSKDMSFDELNDDDRALVADLRDSLDRIDGSGSGSLDWTSTGQQTGYSSAKFSLDGGSQSSSSSSSNSMNSMNSLTINGVQVTLNDGGEQFSIARPGLPDNLARLFSAGKLTTFVYLDGTVQMKPTACLSADEQRLVGQLRLEVQRFRDNMRRFQIDFNRNMQEMGMNLNRNMESMRQNLLNMNQNIRQNIMNNMQGIRNNLIPNRYGPFGGQYGVQPVAQDGYYPTDNSVNPAGGSYNPYGSGASRPFGSDFPFGPNNNPFTRPNFPFDR